MPLFKSQRPRGIGQSVRAMLSSSPRLSGVEQAQAEHLGAQTGHQQALSEQIRLKLEQEREAAQARSDPNLRTEYAGTVAGLDSPTARRFEKFRTGAVEPQIAPMDEEGNPMPPAVYARPENVTPEQERSYRSALASTMANMLATGKTNADQFTQAGGNLLTQAIRGEMTQPNLDLSRQNQLGHSINIRPREPFKTNAQGTVLNEETGTLDETPLAAVAARNAVGALARQRDAAAARVPVAGGSTTGGEAQIPEAIDSQSPWANITDPKKKDDAKMRFGIAADRQINDLQEAAVKASGVNKSIDQFLALNEKVTTGGANRVPGVQTARAVFDPDIETMMSISDRLTPAMRQGLPGAASDRDIAMFRGATVGVEKKRETNRNIGQGLKAANDNLVQRYEFMNEYLTARGHLRGSEQEWSRYLEANPIFDPTQPVGSFELNSNRLPYSQWVASRSPGQQRRAEDARVPASTQGFSIKRLD